MVCDGRWGQGHCTHCVLMRLQTPNDSQKEKPTFRYIPCTRVCMCICAYVYVPVCVSDIPRSCPVAAPSPHHTHAHADYATQSAAAGAAAPTQGRPPRAPQRPRPARAVRSRTAGPRQAAGSEIHCARGSVTVAGLLLWCCGMGQGWARRQMPL